MTQTERRESLLEELAECQFDLAAARAVLAQLPRSNKSYDVSRKVCRGRIALLEARAANLIAQTKP